jgi:hypothetical protein
MHHLIDGQLLAMDHRSHHVQRLLPAITIEEGPNAPSTVGHIGEPPPRELLRVVLEGS